MADWTNAGYAALLSRVKMGCGIPDSITVYDDLELKPLILDALEELRTAGVPSMLLDVEGGNLHPNAETAVILHVKIHRGNDRSDMTRYQRAWSTKVFKLQQWPEDDVWPPEESTDGTDGGTDSGEGDG